MCIMRKKIAFLINTLGHGGAEKVLVNLLNNIDHEKYDVSLICLFKHGVNRDYLNRGIKIRYIIPFLIRGNRFIQKIFSPELLYKLTIGSERFDLVVSFLEGITTRIISGCHDSTKKIAWVHVEMHSDSELLKSFRSTEEYTKAYKSMDAVVGVSKDVINSFSKTTGLNLPYVVKYNVNETSVIKEKSILPINAPFKIDKAGLTFCSVGRLTEQKGYLRLIDVLYRLKKEGYSFHMHILGEGHQKTKIEKKISTYKLNEVITLWGYDPNPYKYVRRCDVFICSSLYEGLSTAVTESLIVGTPVITTKCSGTDELLSDGRFGMVVENNADALYLGLKRLLNNKNIVDDYKSRLAESVLPFEKDKTVKSIEEFFDNIMAN
ncbi:glycosyl transferase [Citrobacter freundii]|nr:glycosyl transferase [Citrobacter freundii]AVD78996.1 glycosyltransferase [Citrobacter freundii]